MFMVPTHLCHIEGEFVVFTETDYDVSLATLHSPLHILQHAAALCDKKWMTPQTLQAFIFVVCHHYNFPALPGMHLP